jgi:4,5-DOPA dioxygenase extradiol
LDHGTWSVLAHLFPKADVPVVQLSINALKPLDYHLDLAARLAPLRDAGIMIVSSGNVVHNLRLIDWTNPDGGADWAHRFDDAVTELMTNDPGNILRSSDHSDFSLAVPTPDHFVPLLYTAALAASDAGATAFLRGYAMGSLSMTCFGIGMEGLPCIEGEGAAGLPEGIPGDQTNT